MTTTAAQLGEWFDAYAAQLVLYVRQWLPDASAQDTIQEVFLKLATQPAPRDVKAWLFTAARNAAISQQHSQQRRNHREKQIAQESAGWFEHRPDDLVDANSAQQVLQTLPADQREIVMLRLWGGLTLSEAAQVTGEPSSTLHSRYQVAITRIRHRLETSCRRKT